MCIVIDTNSLASVFDQESQRHIEFRPVLDWIVYGHGKIVYGGTTYRRELARATKYFRLLIELKKASKIVEVDGTKVDETEQQLTRILSHSDFDDPHIVAIIIVSGCKLICSDDSRAYRFFRRTEFYPKHVQRPHIYSRELNKNLLHDKNIADCCRPLSKLPKATGRSIRV